MGAHVYQYLRKKVCLNTIGGKMYNSTRILHVTYVALAWVIFSRETFSLSIAELTLDTGPTCTPDQASITMHHPNNAPVDEIIIYDPYTYTVAQIRNIQSLLDIDDRREYKGRIAFSKKPKETNTYEVIIHDMTKRDEGIYDVQMIVSSGSMAKGSIFLAACSDSELEPSIYVNGMTELTSDQPTAPMLLNNSERDTIILLTGRGLKADIQMDINNSTHTCKGAKICTVPVSLAPGNKGNLTIEYNVVYLDQCATKTGVRKLWYNCSNTQPAESTAGPAILWIIGGVLGAIILVLLLIIVYLLWRKFRPNQENRNDIQQNKQELPKTKNTPNTSGLNQQQSFKPPPKEKRGIKNQEMTTFFDSLGEMINRPELPKMSNRMKSYKTIN